MAGGVLWALFGVFEMLEPLGAAKVYVESLGYERVTRPPVFQLYQLPGALALALMALALIGVAGRLGLDFPGRRALCFTVLGLALLSLVGTLVLLAPMSILGASLGRLLLGVATLVAALRAYRPPSPRAWGHALLALGLVGTGLLALQPLTWALMWFPPALSAAIMVAFGLGWFALGFELRRVPAVAADGTRGSGARTS
jgi:hypothetical protein